MSRSTGNRKSCARCHRRRSVSFFYRMNSKADGLHPYCKDCADEVVRLWKKSHPERVKQWSRQWYKRNGKLACAIARYKRYQARLAREAA